MLSTQSVRHTIIRNLRSALGHYERALASLAFVDSLHEERSEAIKTAMPVIVQSHEMLTELVNQLIRRC